jgi:hypothetical protein
MLLDYFRWTEIDELAGVPDAIESYSAEEEFESSISKRTIVAAVRSLKDEGEVFDLDGDGRRILIASRVIELISHLERRLDEAKRMNALLVEANALQAEMAALRAEKADT